MAAARVITVLEHEVVPIVSDAEAMERGALPVDGPQPAWLSELEATVLLMHSERGPRFCTRTSAGIQFAQFSGLLRQPSVVIEILPKTGLNDARQAEETTRARRTLLYMLSCVGRLRLSVNDNSDQGAVHAPLLEVFIQAFLQCALEQARRGLLHRYLGRSESLRTARGRFNAHGHVRENMARPHLLYCDFDEFTPDNPYNQAIRATLDVARPWLTSSSGHRLWLEAHARFTDITPRRMHTREVEALRRDRTTAHYEPVLGWCELLLSLLNPTLRSGDASAPGLLFDMNRLFEGYVHHVESNAAAPDEEVVEQGPVAYLARTDDKERFRLKPDLTICRRQPNGLGATLRIVDAKWKRLRPDEARWGVSQHDLYQLLAYAIRYQCTELELVYPAPDGWTGDTQPPSFVIDADGLTAAVRITIRALRLTATTPAAS